MSKTTVPSAMAAVLQNANYFKQTLPIYPNSTLNQKLNIAASEKLLAGEMPSVKYLVIGIGGLKASVNSNGDLKFDSRFHQSTDTSLFKMVPFVLRTLDADLTESQRANYRLRAIITVNDVKYVAYYARVLDLSQAQTSLQKRTVDANGIVTAQDWSPTLENLSPVPQDLTTAGSVSSTGEYIAVTTKVEFTMSPDETQEFINAINILYGDDGYANITEMATVSGVDHTVTGNFNDVQQSYPEVVYAQCACYISTAFVMKVQTDGIAINVDVGNVEPILNTVSS